jgi:FixJ family two-component response regulator
MSMTGTRRRLALIVEDDAILRLSVVDLFEKIGLQSLECESAEAALAMMLTRSPEVILVLSDIRLVGPMDGVDFAIEAKMRWPNLTFILTSGNPGARTDNLPFGVTFIPKPWREIDILAHAQQAMSAAETRSTFSR